MDGLVARGMMAAAIVILFGYWELRERQVQPRRAKTGHTRLAQILIRNVLLLVVILLLVQLAGLIPWTLPLPSGLTRLAAVIGQILFWGGAAREAIGKHWAHAADYQVVAGQELVRRGPYQFIRHPIYTAFFAMLVGVELTLGSWLVALAVPVAWYMWWQAKKEEMLLEREFADRYRAYKEKTGMFVPRLRFG